MRQPLLFVAAVFLAAPAIAQQSNAPLSAEREQELGTLIFAATQAPDFKRSKQLLEVYRTLRAAGVTLTPSEEFEMGNEARKHGLAIEADEMMSSAAQRDESIRQANELLIRYMTEAAKRDRETGLEASARMLAGRADWFPYFSVAEAFAGAGDHARAISLYERALEFTVSEPTKLSDADIAKLASEAARLYGRDASFYSVELQQQRSGLLGVASDAFTPADKAQVQLNYGISLFKLKRMDEARATWSAIAGSPTVEILARAWLDIADRSAN